MATPAARAAPSSRIDALARPLTTEGMAAISEAINRASSAIAEAAGTGANRVFRVFRTSEIMEITGLTDRQIRDWRRRNKTSIAAYQESEHNASGLPQLPLTLGEMHRLMDDFGVRPKRPEGARAIRMGCFNFKGGSTKSSTCLNLSAYFARNGWRVLVIDADPQGSLSTMFGFTPEDTDPRHTLLPTLNSVSSQELFDNITLEPLHTHVDGLDIVPATLDMIGADFDITAAFMNKISAAQEFYRCVDRAIQSVEDRYDLVFIDGAPAFSFSALAAMWASDGMIIPVPPASPDFKATAAFCAMASAGLSSLANRADTPERAWAPVLFVHNRVKSNSQSAEVVQSLSKEAFGRYLCDVTVPDVSAIPNALLRQMSVWEASSTDVDSRGLRVARNAYQQLGNKLLTAIQASWEAGFAQQGEVR